MPRLQQAPCRGQAVAEIRRGDAEGRDSPVVLTEQAQALQARIASGTLDTGTYFAAVAGASPPTSGRSRIMLSWALAFFIIAVIAAIFGFTGIAAGAAEIAKILFVVFVVLFLVSLVAGLLRRP
jgi:uncharacterized membrane protein YtjA (UPF0391 family)